MLLQRSNVSSVLRVGGGDGDGRWPGGITFDTLLAAARRRIKLIAGFAILGACIAYAIGLSMTPLYTASTSVLIDRAMIRVANDPNVPLDGLADSAAIDSQVELMHGEKISLNVVRRADLINDPEFVDPSVNPIVRLWSTLRSKLPFGNAGAGGLDEEFVAERKALSTYQSRLDVKRVGRTNVIQVTFSSEDPRKAAKIANLVVEAYIDDKLNSRYDTSKIASNWLQSRIDEMRSKALQADIAVQDFRSKHGLISAGGRLINEQQLQEINSQLVIASAETARMEARLKRIETILQDKNADAAVNEGVDSTVLSSLRQKYLDTSKREAEVRQRFGETHPAAVSLRNDMTDYERLIFGELGRIAENYRSEYQIAKSREESLQKSLAAVAGQSVADNNTQVQLRELERERDTYSALYQTLLQRFQESLQQQSFPIADARVISDASSPIDPSFPKKSIFAALGLLIGAAVGAAIGGVAEYRDRSFRTRTQIRSELGLPLIGALPNVHVRGPDAAQRLLRYSVDNPLSLFAETLRRAKVSADIALGNANPKVLGVISTLPGEGKSTVAKNLASLLARLGQRTLLIDADLRHPQLTKSVGASAKHSLVDVLQGTCPLGAAVVVEEGTGLNMLLAGQPRQAGESHPLLASPEMQKLISSVSDRYDYIIFDLPPIGPVVDVRAAAGLFSALIMVLEWGRTPVVEVRQTLAEEGAIRDKLVGVILNKVDLKSLALYETPASAGTFSTMYGKYYRSSQGNKAA